MPHPRTATRAMKPESREEASRARDVLTFVTVVNAVKGTNAFTDAAVELCNKNLCGRVCVDACTHLR